ncbi:MAG: flagellar hook-associated protein FlgK [Paracoccaceae bacterium]|nr:flagellar hook-associated protein FlgK [Paracoccaceae bacterium]
MSISGSLNNAFSGLTAAARGAEVVSQNLANVLTEGYGRRELLLSTRSLAGAGAGVRVDGIARVVNQVVLSDRRLAEAAQSSQQALRDFHAQVESLVGAPGEPGALTTRLDELEAALVAAASRPDSGPRLDAVLAAAQGLSGQFVAISNGIQEQRMAADAAIAGEVDRLNTALERIVELNRDIRVELASGRDTTAFQDERQRLIDAVSEIVPLREIPREDGQVALFTTGGAVLLDGLAGEIGFTATATITPDMTLASGALSGLSFRGLPATASATAGMLGGGTLGALMTIRDELAPAAQTRLDAVARDLVERFEDPAADPSRAPGAPGLFTDRGAALSAAYEVGLAARLAVNAAVDPARGGALWRLRDGLGAAVPGPVGQAAGLNALAAALSAQRTPASGAFVGGARSASGLAAEFLSGVGVARQTTESGLAYASARAEALKSAELAEGVDSDRELQHLLLVEQAYSANARVLSAAEAMLDRLMEIGR